MSLELFQAETSPVHTEIFNQHCAPTWQSVESLAKTLKQTHPKLRFIHITHPYKGTGVAEMLPYVGGMSEQLGIPMQWWVLASSLDYLKLGQRVHTAIHGSEEDALPFTNRDTQSMMQVAKDIKPKLQNLLKPNDVVILHEPHTLPLAEHAAKITPHVFWRCHSGRDTPNKATQAAWKFLEPFLIKEIRKCLFTRLTYAPEYLPKEKIQVEYPVIHPLAWKNMPLSKNDIHLIYEAMTGKHNHVDIHDCPPLSNIKKDVSVDGCPPQNVEAVNIVSQIGWWNTFKDHFGTLRMFADNLSSFPKDTYLFLVGPRLKDMPNNHEALNVWHDILEYYKGLPEQVQKHVVLWRLSVQDRTKNALMINALQQLSTVVIQKSFQEGFGLTVTESMWKGKAVVGSAVGGIQDQIQNEETGFLLKDPNDLKSCAQLTKRLLESEPLRHQLGQNAKAFVATHFLLPHLLQTYYQMIA